MIITSTSLDALRVGFKTDFQTGLGMVEDQRQRVATTVPSTTAENRYGWMKKLTGMREWIGARIIDNIAESDYSIRNRDFEKTIGVDRNDIEDDNLGQYSMLFRELGEAAGALPETMVWEALKNGFTSNCFDGQFFFDTDHPIIDADGKPATFSNTGGGSGTPWFLLSTKRTVKPIIFQERKPLAFVYKDRSQDDNVFWDRQFIYGAERRCNVGYGFPQMAYGSKQTLDQAAYKAAYGAIEAMKGDGGRPLGLKPDLLVVPPALREVGLELLNAERNSAGATNVWRGTAELLVVPWLA